VVSHDRYFLERVCDSVWALLGDGQISMLPRGVDEYLERQRGARDERRGWASEGRASDATEERGRTSGTRPGEPQANPKPGSADERTARKTLARIDKQLARVAEREKALDAEIASHAHDHVRLAELSAEYAVVRAEREQLEQEWLEAAELLE
jgi:ABC transport system ATP-binding/permease protein